MYDYSSNDTSRWAAEFLALHDGPPGRSTKSRYEDALSGYSLVLNNVSTVFATYLGTCRPLPCNGPDVEGGSERVRRDPGS